MDIRALCNFILLNNGAGVNLCNEKGFSPLHAEFENGHASVVQQLLNNSAEVNLSQGRT